MSKYYEIENQLFKVPDDDWHLSGSVITSSRDVLITGSIEVSGGINITSSTNEPFRLYAATGDFGRFYTDQSFTGHYLIFKDNSLSSDVGIKFINPNEDEARIWGNSANVIGYDAYGHFFNLRTKSGSQIPGTLNVVLYTSSTQLTSFTIDGQSNITLRPIHFSLGTVFGGISSSLSFTGSIADFTNVNQIIGIKSSSYALTASYAENAGGGTGFPYTGSAQITGSLIVTGSTTITKAITGSFLLINGIGRVITMSVSRLDDFFGSGQYIDFLTNNAVLRDILASDISASSYESPPGIINNLTSSYAITASYALNGGGSGADTDWYQSGSFLTSSADVQITGSLVISSSLGTQSGSTLIVRGSGSANPVFLVEGASGELFSITDTLSGSLFSVHNEFGLPILETFSDNQTLIGNYIARSLYTTAVITSTTSSVTQSVYSVSTSSYDGAFFEYTATSASNARAGNIMAIWNGGSVQFNESTTSDIGSTSDVLLSVEISASRAHLLSKTNSDSWKIKTIVRSI